MRPIKKIESIYKESEKNTRFEPTYYLIYDRSTKTECNRLIRVMPFNWVIWAINSDIYIIETTGPAVCPSGTTPAIQVVSDIYSMQTTCLSVLFQSILNLYPGNPHKVFYDIEKSSVPHKFTILDALNDLLQRYLTVSFNKEAINQNRLFYINSSSANFTTQNYTLKKKYEFVKPQHHMTLFKRILKHHSLATDTLTE